MSDSSVGVRILRRAGIGMGIASISSLLLLGLVDIEDIAEIVEEPDAGIFSITTCSLFVLFGAGLPI